jgi:hypothetical protein
MACRARKPQKTEKTQNKMLFLRRGPPVFLPKRPKKGPFLLSVRFLEGVHAPYGLDGEELTQISENRHFSGKRAKSPARPPDGAEIFHVRSSAFTRIETAWTSEQIKGGRCRVGRNTKQN